MGTEDSDPGGPNRRDFLKATGAATLTTAIAGCDQLPDETEDGTEGGTTAGTNGGDGTTAGGDGGDGGSDALAARPYAVNAEFAAEESDLVRSTFGEAYYTRVEGIPGVDAGDAGVTPAGHAVTYGHEMATVEEEPPAAPTVNVLSAGVLSLPVSDLEGVGSTPYAEAPLSDLVALGEGNLFLAAAGLSRSVEWITDPVSVERTEAEFLDGGGTVETFVGVVSGESGPGLPGEVDAGYLSGGTAQPRGHPVQPRGHLVTVHAARTMVGGDLVMMGMVGGWRRPPTMGPPTEEIGPEMQGLLADLYQDMIRAALFRESLGSISPVEAGMLPDEDERPPPPKEELIEEPYSTTIGLDEDDQIELGYPTEETHDDYVWNSFTLNRDVPGLFSGESFDPDEHSRGTSYLVKPEMRATAYTVDGDDGRSIPFGVVASPLVEVEGEERNTLATMSLSEVMTYLEGGWDLLRWAGDLGDFDWTSGPTVSERLSGPDLLGESGEVRGFEGSVTKVVDGTSSSEDVILYAARVLTDDEVVLAVALTEDHGDGYFDRSSTVQGMFEECVRRTMVGPDTPTDWVDASIDDLNLVQICSNTRLETASGDVLGQPDPPLVEDRFTAPPFDVSTFDGTAFSGYDDPLHAVFTFDVENRSSVFETVLDRSSLTDLDQGNVDPDVLFDGNGRDGDPDTDLPVFELAGSDASVTLEAQAPSGHTYDTRTIREGTDYSITDMDVLRVGFITISDPEDGANYGDGSGGPTNYETTVEAAFEYLKRTYPTGLAAYRHDRAIEGVTFALNDNATQNETKDYRNARVALERIAKPGNNNWSYSGVTMAHGISASDARSGIRSNGFDLWVLIVPNGYYQFHRDGRPSGLAPWNDDLAVTAVEGARNGRARAAETVAQEIGHRIERSPYRSPGTGNGQSNPLSQRDDDGTNTANRDFDHARHLSSNNDGSTPTDGPGVVSRAYSLAEGEFVVPTHTAWNSGYRVWTASSIPTPFGGYGPGSSPPARRLGRMESYMSYSGRSVWADSVITQDVIESDFNRESGNYQTFQVAGGLNEVSAASGGEDSDGESDPTLTGMQILEDWVTGPDEERLAEAESVVEVAMLGPDGERLATTRSAAEAGVDGHDVEDGRLAGDTSFSVEFPPEAVETVFDTDNGRIRTNPITRTIRDAYARLPDEAVAADPATVRDRIDSLLGTVDALVSDGEYGVARDELAAYVETELPEHVRPEFEPLANQPNRGRLEWVFGRMIGRLDGLADDGGTDDDIEAGDPPAWSRWVPEPSALPVFGESRVLWQYDVSGVLESGGGDLGVADDDPMTNPAITALAASLSWAELDGVGVGEPVLGPAIRETDVDPAEVPAETGLIVGDTHVYLGSFDVAALEEAVAASEFSETDVSGVYSHGSSDLVIAYGETYVLAGRTVEAVERLRATGAGDVERWIDSSEEVARLLGAGAAGDFTLVVHRGEETITDETGESLDLSPFVGASGLAQSLSVDAGSATDGTAGVVYPPETSPEMDRLRETLGVGAADREFTTDGRFVTVRASYDGPIDG